MMMKIITITIKIMMKCHSGKYKSAATKVRSTMVLNDPSYPTLSTTNSYALLFNPHSKLNKTASYVPLPATDVFLFMISILRLIIREKGDTLQCKGIYFIKSISSPRLAPLK
jgi:hypothetical protein